MFARYGDTRGMDYMRLNPMRTKPARQPEAVPTSFEGQCNPRDLAAGLDRLVAPAMQQGKQPFWVRLQLLAGLALNAGKHTGNQPTRWYQARTADHRAATRKTMIVALASAPTSCSCKSGRSAALSASARLTMRWGWVRAPRRARAVKPFSPCSGRSRGARREQRGNC